jgi:cysteine synthase
LRIFLKAFHARIEIITEPDPDTGEYLPARIRRVKQLLKQYPNSYWPNQYSNLENAASHYHTTMKEIMDRLPQLDYLFCGVSTCGTIRGCCEYVRDHGLSTRIIAVDARGSAVFSGEKSVRLLPGLGAAVRPSLCPDEGIHDVVHVSDIDCIEGCRTLAKEEAILAGGSSGGVLSAVYKYRDRIEAGSICAAILPDRGERYLDTVYAEDWVQENLGRYDSDKEAACEI